jgi:signal transduction histidine kinase
MRRWRRWPCCSSSLSGTAERFRCGRILPCRGFQCRVLCGRHFGSPAGSSGDRQRGAGKRQRGVDLNNQTVISQRVIEEMQDGVLVLSRDGRVSQSNPRARQLLALHGGSEVSLSARPNWRRVSSIGAEPRRGRRCSSTGAGEWHAVASAVHSHRRALKAMCLFFSRTWPSAEQAQQIKLAALGRLTANIAHEIRNPLSAISHAGELMREERRGELYERLLRIVLDNAQRLERIVSDVLELGRRDRSYRERSTCARRCLCSSRSAGPRSTCRQMWSGWSCRAGPRSVSIVRIFIRCCGTC